MKLLRLCLVLSVLISLSSFAEQPISGDVQSATNAIIPPPRREVPGIRHALSLGTLYIPDYYHLNDLQPVDLVFFFHGAAWCAEQNFYDAHKNAVLISISGVNYGEVFQDVAILAGLMDEALEKVKAVFPMADGIGKVCLTSFSGGYTAVREILKQPEYQAGISDVVLADSLYAPRVKDATNQLEPDALKPFLDYARRAAAGECTFLYSHLYPPDPQYRGNTTTLAAEYLLERLGVERIPSEEVNKRGVPIAYRADREGFHILGYSGMTQQDHFEHFYSLSDLLRLTSLTDGQNP